MAPKTSSDLDPASTKSHKDKVKESVNETLRQNIRTLRQHKADALAHETWATFLAEGATKFSGSLWFVYLHIIWFGIWIVWNVGAFGVTPFDPFPFGLLTVVVSLEAIFLSTFVLISQNQQAAVSEKQAELDLQTNLLAEQEITQLMILIDAIADHLGVDRKARPDLEEFESSVSPEAVLNEIENQMKKGPKTI